MNQQSQSSDQPDVKQDHIRPIWDNAEQLSALRDRAGQCGDPLAKVLFEASLHTLEDQQQAQAFRERVTEALMTRADTVATSAQPDEDTTQTQESLPRAPERHLKPPHPVSLYEDPLKYKTPNPSSITAMSHVEQDQVAIEMEESRETAILMSEVHNEIFRPVVGLAACIGLIVLIGFGAYVKGWIGQPKTASATPAVQQPELAPITPATK